MFHAKETDNIPMLHLDTTNLFNLIPSEVADGDVLRACGRLIAESKDSEVSIDGTRAFQRAEGFGTLSDAISILVAGGATVTQREAWGVPTVSTLMNGFEVTVFGKWCAARLVHSRKGGRDSDAGDLILHETSPAECFVLRVDHVPLSKDMLASDTLNWCWVVRTPSFALRVAKTDPLLCPKDNLFHVYLYRSGIFWKHEQLEASHLALHGVCYHIDTIYNSRGDHLDWIPPFPNAADLQGAGALGMVFLQTEFVQYLSNSEIVRRLVTCANPWRSILIDRWSHRGDDRAQSLVNILNCPMVDDSFIKLVDGRILFDVIGKDDRINIIGLSIFRRLQSTCSSVDFRATVVSEFSVGSIGIMPLSKARYSELFHMGLMSCVDNVCEFGFLYGYGMERILVVPNDVDVSDVTFAISRLCAITISVDDMRAEVASTGNEPLPIVIESGMVFSEASDCPVANEMLYPHRIRINISESSIVLQKDATTGSQRMRHVTSLDDITPSTIPYDPANTHRHELAILFPEISKRLERQEYTIEACFREAQSRRVSREWTLESIDNGGNLSSLGMSIMLALLLREVVGVRVRVFIGQSRGAVVGVWTHQYNAFVLFDPTKTLKNTFDIAPYISVLPKAIEWTYLKKGTIGEYKIGTKWLLAQVVRIQPNFRTATVNVISKKMQMQVAYDQSTWRPLSADDRDIEKVINKLLKDENKATPHDEDDPTVKSKRARHI